jgi:parallel beta-helix repeat protein
VLVFVFGNSARAASEIIDLEVGVEGEYQTITEAVYAAATQFSKSTVRIWVYPGTYRENVVINVEGLTIEGVGDPNEIVIEPDQNKHVISVEASRVEIRNVTVTGATLLDQAGVFVENTTGVTLSKIVSCSNSRGVYIINSTDCTIQQSIITNNSKYGIALAWVQNCTIRDNDIINNGIAGIRVVGRSDNPSHSNTIEFNHIADNGAYGLELYGQHVWNTNVNWNDVVGNITYGLESTNSVQAAFNWWGHHSGPSGGPDGGTGDKVNVMVNYGPWLGAPVGATPMTFHLDATSKTSKTISETIQIADPGDTIVLHPGHYTENVVLDQSITLRGAGGVERPVLRPETGAALVIRAGSATVQGIELLRMSDSPGVIIVGTDAEGANSPTGVVLGGPDAIQNDELRNVFSGYDWITPAITLTYDTQISTADVEARYNDWGDGATRDSIAEAVYHQDQNPALGRVDFLPAYAGTEIITRWLIITTDNLPPATAGQSYEAILEAAGGDENYYWELLGALPDGLELTPDGLITGVPVPDNGDRTHNFTVRVTDRQGETAERSLSLLVQEAQDQLKQEEPERPPASARTRTRTGHRFIYSPAEITIVLNLGAYPGKPVRVVVPGGSPAVRIVIPRLGTDPVPPIDILDAGGRYRLYLPAGSLAGGRSAESRASATVFVLRPQPALSAIAPVVQIKALHDNGQPLDAFDSPVHLGLRYKPASPSEEVRLGVYRYDSETGSWRHVGGRLDRNSRLAWVPLTSFGSYTVLSGGEHRFADVPKDHPAGEAIGTLAARRILRGTGADFFFPGAVLDRAQAAALILRLLYLKPDRAAHPAFPDVRPDSWFFDPVQRTAALGLICGYPDGSFRPHQGISEQEFLCLLARLLERNGIRLSARKPAAPAFHSGRPDGPEPAPWAAADVARMWKHGIVREAFTPNAPVTRERAAVWTCRVLELLETREGGQVPPWQNSPPSPRQPGDHTGGA